MIKRYEYIGPDYRLKGMVALGSLLHGRDFEVQTNRSVNIYGVDWAIGWHRSPIQDWKVIPWQ